MNSGEDNSPMDSDEDRSSISPAELADIISRHHLGKCHTTVSEERIKHLLNDDISQVSAILRVSRGLACTLLRRNKWRRLSLFDKWFADKETLLKEAGVLSEQKVPKEPDNNCCKIYFQNTNKIVDYDDNDNTLLSSATCGVHPFCPDCWKNYIAVSINEGPGLTCPEPACKAEMGVEIVDAFASDEDKDKYYDHLVLSYIDGDSNLRRCPRPGCGLVIHRGIGNNDVTCDCSCCFCFVCSEENHHPVDCETANKWVLERFKEHSDGYPIYYERWALNDNLGDIDLGNVHRARDELILVLALVQNEPKDTLEFVIKALEKIVECRGVLKWSHAYGYYVSLAQPEKKALFEHMQEEAKAALERLHHCAHKEIEKYLNADSPLPDFKDFRDNMVRLTHATGVYIESLARAVENDLHFW